MYAVIATGGKQYRVIKGETLRVEKLAGEEGSKVELDGVLMVVDGDNVEVGTPMLDKGAVTARIKSHGRGKKIEIIKFRRRKNSRTQAGHRQRLNRHLKQRQSQRSRRMSLRLKQSPKLRQNLRLKQSQRPK